MEAGKQASDDATGRHDTLALPAPSDTAANYDEVSALPIGASMKLESLGPVVVNTDGTLSRISNWDQLSEREKEVAKRRVAKRNQERLDELRAKGDIAAFEAAKEAAAKET